MPKNYNISPEYYDKLAKELAKYYHEGMVTDEEVIERLKEGGYIDKENKDESK